MSKVLKSGEDYLEAILILKNKQGSVRSIDVAMNLNFSKPSVSVAVHKLEESGHITIDENGLIELTESGYKIASNIYERHRVLTEMFVRMGVDPEVAQEDACKVEHDISDETFEAIKRSLK